MINDKTIIPSYVTYFGVADVECRVRVRVRFWGRVMVTIIGTYTCISMIPRGPPNNWGIYQPSRRNCYFVANLVSFSSSFACFNSTQKTGATKYLITA